MKKHISDVDNCLIVAVSILGILWVSPILIAPLIALFFIIEAFKNWGAASFDHKPIYEETKISPVICPWSGV